MLKYEKELTVPEKGFDEFGNFLPGEVLTMFEKLAGEHAQYLGVGFEAMAQRGLLWVITAVRYQVCGDLLPGQKIVGSTWPLPQTKAGFVREYLLCGEKGEVLIKGTSNWVLIHTDSRQLAISAGIYPEGEYCMDRNFADKTRRIRDFETTGKETLIRPDASSIDINGHVNNTCYAEFVRYALGGFAGRIDIFQIDYLREVLCGQELFLCAAQEGKTSLVKGVSREGQRMFTCSMTLK